MLSKVISRHTIITMFVIILCLSSLSEVFGQNYIGQLVKNLIAIKYSLTPEEIVALDKIEMRFDSINRIDVLKKILMDRDSIHNRKVDYFVRTEIICDALHLLDEHDLPPTSALIDTLNQQKGWEPREEALLAYMAAKRNIRYDPNVSCLLQALRRGSSDYEQISNIEIQTTVLDVCNYLSYLADLFIYQGDKNIFDSLILYASHTYGYPAEYLSHKFVDMLLRKPKVFIALLAQKPDNVRNKIIISLRFGISNNVIRENVKNVLQDNKPWATKRELYIVTLLMNGLREKNSLEEKGALQ